MPAGRNRFAPAGGLAWLPWGSVIFNVTVSGPFTVNLLSGP